MTGRYGGGLAIKGSSGSPAGASPRCEEGVRELVEEAGLAHPGLPDDGHDLALPRRRPAPRRDGGPRAPSGRPTKGVSPRSAETALPRPRSALAATQLTSSIGPGSPLTGTGPRGDPHLGQPHGLGRQPEWLPGGASCSLLGRQVRGLADGGDSPCRDRCQWPRHSHLARVEASCGLYLETMPAAHLLAIVADGSFLHGQRRIGDGTA